MQIIQPRISCYLCDKVCVLYRVPTHRIEHIHIMKKKIFQTTLYTQSDLHYTTSDRIHIYNVFLYMGNSESTTSENLNIGHHGMTFHGNFFNIDL